MALKINIISPNSNANYAFFIFHINYFTAIVSPQHTRDTILQAILETAGQPIR
uniref:Uncharacterized protein n=1 Tax=Anguilla anguilla TaxID=7936 RepID=A0A0E9UF56_ANGAN